MALDIFQLLFQALRIQDLAYKYTNPVDQFLYLIFFPSLIIIAIVTLFTSKVFSGKLAFLFTFAFYIFIIVYPPGGQKNIYSAIAPLGELWFLGFAVIAVLWFLFRFPFSHGGSGGKSGGGLFGLGGGLSGLQTREGRKGLIVELHEIDEQLKAMQIYAEKMKAHPDEGDYAKLFEAAREKADAKITSLSVFGAKHGDISGKRARYNKIIGSI